MGRFDESPLPKPVTLGGSEDPLLDTDFFGNACTTRGDPFINNCRYDGAGSLLQWIYGNLQPDNTGTLIGNIIEFASGSSFSPGTAWVTGAGSMYHVIVRRVVAACMSSFMAANSIQSTNTSQERAWSPSG